MPIDPDVLDTGRKTVRETYQDITRDPREGEDWFLRMPPEAQQELREVWCNRRVRHLPWRCRNRRMRMRCLGEGIVVLLMPGLFVGGWWLALLAVPIGALLGFCWAALRTGRMQSALLSMAAMLLLLTASGFWSSKYDIVAFLLSAFSILLTGLLGAALGFGREIDRREQAL